MIVQLSGVGVSIATLYLAAAMAQGLQLGRRVDVSRAFVLALGGLAWGLHGSYGVSLGLGPGGWQWLFLLVWLAAGIVLLWCSGRSWPASLVLAIVPCAAASVLLLPLVSPMGQLPVAGALFHAFSAEVAICVLLLYGGIALLLLLQEQWLKHKTHSAWVQVLPPLQTTEQLLFYTLKFAVALLSVVAVSSCVIFGHQIMLELVVRQKLVVVATIWGIFVLLLLGHQRFGWRGMPAALASLFGVLLSVVVYLWSAQTW